jgi:hypothetical protein
MSTPLAANECRRQVRYDYTKDERIQKAITLGESLDRYAATEAELSRIKKDYTARLDGIQAEVDGLNLAVRTGYELREYICYWTYDEPKQGRKTLRKREGGEIVAEEDMTERDRQMVMEIIDAQATAAAATTRGEKLALHAPAEWPVSPGEVILTEDHQEADSDLTSLQVDAYNTLLREIMLRGDHSAATRCVATLEEAADVLGSVIENTSNDDLERMAEWLTTGRRAQIPGAEWIASEIQTYLDAVRQQEAMQAEARKAAEAAAKKEARKGRRAAGSGTVEVAADEGSRDDFGPDSKNNL